jgi:hypothetical protein
VSLVWQLAEGRGWQPASQQLDRILDVDEDLAIINWVTASTFLLAGLLAVRAGSAAPRRDRPWWWLLAAGTLFVSLDEAVGANDPVRVAVEQAVRAGGGPLLLVAVLGVGALLASLAVLRVLPRGVRWRALLAVLLVVTAAVGVDSLGPDLADQPERRLETWYVLKATLEEALELVAAVLLLDAMVLTGRRTRPGSVPGSGRELPAGQPHEQDERQAG